MIGKPFSSTGSSSEVVAEREASNAAKQDPAVAMATCPSDCSNSREKLDYFDVT
jgi:hypothetical protein